MLAELFGSKLRAKTLSHLVLHPEEALYVRQLAALLGEDPTNVSRELARLERLGLVSASVSGRQKYYRIEPSNPVYRDLRGLVLKTTGLGDVLRRALQPLSSRIALAFVFGSMPRGDTTRSSDIDLMVVGDAGFRDVVDAVADAQRELAREVNPVVYSREEFRRKAHARQGFLPGVLKQPKQFVIGTDRELRELAA